MSLSLQISNTTDLVTKNQVHTPPLKKEVFSAPCPSKSCSKKISSSPQTRIPFTLYRNRFTKNYKESTYKILCAIQSQSDYDDAVQYDSTPIKFKDSHRKKSNWLGQDVLIFDIDNDDPNNRDFWEDERNWLTLEKIQELLSGVECYISTSQNHNKDKSTSSGVLRPARPKFHIHLPLGVCIEDPEEILTLNAKLQQLFTLKSVPYGDPAVQKLSSFLSGVKNRTTSYHSGHSILELLAPIELPKAPKKKGSKEAKSRTIEAKSRTIPALKEIETTGLDETQKKILDFLRKFDCVARQFEGNGVGLHSPQENTPGGYYLFLKGDYEDIRVHHHNPGKPTQNLDTWLSEHYPLLYKKHSNEKPVPSVIPYFKQDHLIDVEVARRSLAKQIWKVKEDTFEYLKKKERLRDRVKELKEAITTLKNDLKACTDSSVKMELRNNLKLKSSDRDQTILELEQLAPPRIIIKGDVGLGKTTAVIDEFILNLSDAIVNIRLFGGLRTHILVPNHKLAQDIHERIKEKIELHHSNDKSNKEFFGNCHKGRTRENMCQIHMDTSKISESNITTSVITELPQKGQSVFSSVCKQYDAEGEVLARCSNYYDCNYLNQFRDEPPEGYDYVILTHDALITPTNEKFKYKTPEICVIDERFQDKFERKSTVKKEEIERYLQKIKGSKIKESRTKDLFEADQLMLELLCEYDFKENIRDYYKSKIAEIISKIELSHKGGISPDGVVESFVTRMLSKGFSNEQLEKLKESLTHIAQLASTQADRSNKIWSSSSIHPGLSTSEIFEELRRLKKPAHNISKFIKIIKDNFDDESCDFS